MAPPGVYEITCAIDPSMNGASKTVVMTVFNAQFNGLLLRIWYTYIRLHNYIRSYPYMCINYKLLL